MVFIEAMEGISDIAVPPRAAYLRVVANELDRIASHLIANFSYCYTIEHETLAMYLLNTRETVLDNLERLTGSRINTAYMIPGGVRFDLLPEDAAVMLADLAKVEDELKRYVRIFRSSRASISSAGAWTHSRRALSGAAGSAGRVRSHTAVRRPGAS